MLYIGQTPTLKGSFIGRIEQKYTMEEGVFNHDSALECGVSLNGYGRAFDANSYYEGNIKDDQAQWFGRMVYRDGRVQEG